MQELLPQFFSEEEQHLAQVFWGEMWGLASDTFPVQVIISEVDDYIRSPDSFTNDTDPLLLLRALPGLASSMRKEVRNAYIPLLIQIAYERGTKNEKEFLESVIGKPHITQQELEDVRRIVTHSGSLEYSKELEKEMVLAGTQALTLLPPSEQKELLIELAHYIITREK